MKVEQIALEKLKPFSKNPKIHPSEQIKKLVRSIEKFGWTNPVLAIKHMKENLIIAGHARVEAAREKGLRTVPVIFLDMPYEKAIAYNVADNRLAELAEWDDNLLLEAFKDIEISGIDVELTGFDFAEISSLRTQTMEVKEDDFDAQKAYEEIKEPNAKLGDVYLLGEHRLMAGDSTKKDDVERLMGKYVICPHCKGENSI